MNRILFPLFFIFTLISYAQINTFKLNCVEEFTVDYRTAENDETIELGFLWNAKQVIDIGAGMLPTLIDGNEDIIKEELINIINTDNGFRVSINELNDDFKFTDGTKSKVQYSMKKSYIKKGITKYDNDNFINLLYSSLKNETGKTLCGSVNFKTKLINELNSLKEKILTRSTRSSKFRNKNIIEIKDPKETLDKREDPLYNTDIRNPIAFTRFIVRNPRINGVNILNEPGNYAAYHYIRPGSIINIIFDDYVYKDLNNAELTIKAFLKRKNGTVVPINVSGFYEVEEKTNKSEFEVNSLKENQSEEKLDYNYTISTISNTPIQTEVNTSIENPQPEDKLIITISNSSDGNVSFTTTFEYEDYGWETSASGGFSWVNSKGQANNFKPAGSSGMSFYFKRDKGASFWKHFITPSFGPELIILQNEDGSSTDVGLGVSISTFLRTFKVGYGWYLTGNNGKPYFSIGVNFVEGYKSLSTILSRSKE